MAAITRLPYYRRVPRNFPVARAAEVLRERFPVVTKETLLENRDKLYPNAGNPRMWYSLAARPRVREYYTVTRLADDVRKLYAACCV